MTRTPGKQQRVQGLLGRGYFPDELPPAFTTAALARAFRPLTAAWGTASNAPPTQYEVFSIPRAGHARRNLALVNPVSYLHLATFIADNWVSIRKFLRSSKYSKSTPEFVRSGRRALTISSFDQIELQRLLISSKFHYILRTDVSRFYPSIYTHSVPWALYGKPWCKANLHSSLKGSLGDQMDVLLRKCQGNQTIGIPIGPDTSRIAGEIIGVGVDSQLQKDLKLNDLRAYRYIDDFYIGFNQNSECEQAIHIILKALLAFELDINNDKTSIAVTGESLEPDWPYELRRFRFGSKAITQRKSLEEYFHRALYIAKGIEFENVLEYAIKRTRSVRVLRANWTLYEAFLMKVARINPSSIPTIVQILVNYNDKGYRINRSYVGKLIEDSVLYLAPRGHHGEVAWALFLAKALRIQLSAKAASAISEIESSICALVALDLRSRGLIRRGLELDNWVAALEPEALRGRMWLLAYEADLKGWLKAKTPNFVDNHKYFSELKTRCISFYDEGKNVERIDRTMRRERRWAKAWDERVLKWGISP